MRRGDGSYTKSSLLTNPVSNQQDAYYCDVTYDGTKTKKSKQFPLEWCAEPTSPQVHLLHPPCEDSSMDNQLELVCILLNFRPNRVDVTWLQNGKEISGPTGVSLATSTDGSSAGQSHMTITRKSWEKGDNYTCKVTHPTGGRDHITHDTSKCLACLRSSLEPMIYMTKPSYEDLIRQPGRVTCLVLGYDLAATTITWEVDGKVSSAAKTEPIKKNSNGTSSLLSSQTVSLAQWVGGSKFTCKAATPCSGELTQHITTSSKGISKKEPSVTVSRAYQEDTSGNRVSLTLICEASGFYPQEISILWLKNNSQEVKSTYNSGSMSARGTFSAYSILKVERREGAGNYSCVVHHPALKEPKMVVEKVFFGGGDCDRHTLEVFILPPSLEELYVVRNATITCAVSGMETPSSLEVSWRRASGGPLDVASREPVLQDNGTYSTTSILQVRVEEWQVGEEFTCTVKHQDIPSEIVKTICKSQEVSLLAPSVYIFPPHAEELALQELATITCLATGFRPRDILVTWTQQERPVPQEAYTNVGPVQEAGNEERYFIYSKLSVLASDWHSGDTFACVVGHEGLPLTFIHRSVDKASGKPAAINVSVVVSDTEVTCY